jgi:YHS domain-containing protein
MKQAINADPHGKISLQGYDSAAFHAHSHWQGGERHPAISAEYRGYKYLFSSEANKVIFGEEIDLFLQRNLALWHNIGMV